MIKAVTYSPSGHTMSRGFPVINGWIRQTQPSAGDEAYQWEKAGVRMALRPEGSAWLLEIDGDVKWLGEEYDGLEESRKLRLAL